MLIFYQPSPTPKENLPEQKSQTPQTSKSQSQCSTGPYLPVQIHFKELQFCVINLGPNSACSTHINFNSEAQINSIQWDFYW